MSRPESRLTPDNAFIWRIVHRDNLPWLLAHGLHCPSSSMRSPDWISIGNEDVIEKRLRRIVPIAPGGCLADYVPFYFSPFSPMLLNVITGYRGIRQRRRSEIVILVGKLRDLAADGVPYVFTNRHALKVTAEYFGSVDDLDAVDWALLQSRDFRRDQNDLDKFDRYEAEALIHRHLPVQRLAGIVCYDTETQRRIIDSIGEKGLMLDVRVRPGWYF